MTVWTDARVSEVSKSGVRIGNDRIEASTVIWAAGVKASELNAKLGTPLDKQGRLIVGNDCSLPGQPNVFVIGDQACFEGVNRSNALPRLGSRSVAARAIRRAIDFESELKGRARQPFKYLDKGQLATIGRRQAVLQIGAVRMSGFFAWLAWLIVHIYYLIGFTKNRMQFVIWQWAYAYFTYKRGARLMHQEPFLSNAIEGGDQR